MQTQSAMPTASQDQSAEGDTAEHCYPVSTRIQGSGLWAPAFGLRVCNESTLGAAQKQDLYIPQPLGYLTEGLFLFWQLIYLFGRWNPYQNVLNRCEVVDGADLHTGSESADPRKAPDEAGRALMV